MNILALRGLTLFACAFLNLVLAFILWRKSKVKKEIFYLSLLALFSGLYAFVSGGTYFFWRAGSFSSVIWYRSTWLGVLMLPSFVSFTYYFTRKTKYIRLKVLFLYLGAIIISFLALTTPLFVKSVYLKYPHIPGVAGPFDPIGRLFILFCIILGVVHLIKEYFKTSGFPRLQIKYLILGLILYAIAGISFTGVIPLVIGESPYYDILAYFSLFWIALTSYAIIKYRLMDIRVVLGRTAVYFLSFATVIALAFLLAFFNNLLVQPLSLNVSGPLIIVISLLLFRPIFRVFEKIASKYFYYTFYSYQQVLAGLGKRLTQFLDLGKLSSLITNTLINTMKLDRTVVLLREPETGDYQIQRNIGFQEENGISLVKDNFLTIWLERSKKPLVYEELSLIIRDVQNREEKEKLEKLKENMKRIEANLCLPLFIEEKIIGMIILGNKISKEPYSQQDIELLTALSSQSSIALYNARLYDQIQDLSQNLQKKVDEQTREIKKAYEVEKQAHEELKKLDLAKTQFTKAATHHLRTPLTSIIGFLELILGGSYGKLENREIKKRIISVRKSADILQGLIEDILDITLLRTGKAILNLEPTRLEKVIEDIVKEEKPQAKNKGIYLKWEKPKTPFPKLMLDRKRIKEAIYNIVDNAVKYTEEGGVEIKTEHQKSQSKEVILTSISDTGIGLSEEEQKMFLQGEYFFERGKEAEKLWGPGRGIGLVISHEFIKAHQGKLWVESAGRNKGSTFYVELPITSTHLPLTKDLKNA